MSTTIGRAPELLHHGAPTKDTRITGRTVLLGSGIAASLVYVAANVLGAMRWEGYSTVNQAVSELSAIDAPSRPLMVTLLFASGVLALAFGLGVLWSAGGNRALRMTGWFLVAIGVVDQVALFFPMHMRGVETTWTDTGHMIVTSLNVLPIFLAMGFGAAAFEKRFRIYSVVTLATALVFGATAGMQGPQIGANEPTPWHGVYERINIGAYLLWMAVLAIVLLRARGGAAPKVTAPHTPGERLQAIREAATEFLGHKRIAVTGVSKDPGSHGSNVVYQRLRDRGYEVFAVNPNADEVEGDPCYHDLKSIPGGVDAVVIGTSPAHADAATQECHELGIRNVWMHRSFGKGSVSESATSRTRARHHRHRRWVPTHVRALLGRRPQSDALRVHHDRQSAQEGLNRLFPSSDALPNVTRAAQSATLVTFACQVRSGMGRIGLAIAVAVLLEPFS